jgi:hypothetical protein
MTRPWRDIYPVDFWVSLVTKYQRPDASLTDLS